MFLQHVSGTQLDFDMAINLLEAYSIPVVCQYPNDGEFGKLILGIAEMCIRDSSSISSLH